MADSAPVFPPGRVKKIVKLDKDIKKVNSEALFLISSATSLFLQHLAESSAKVAMEKKRKTLGLEHLRAAVKGHVPTRVFLADSLPKPLAKEKRLKRERGGARAEKELHSGERRIEDFFKKQGPGTDMG
ncbi:chromatin accessibility complex protein 1 [Amborella trichopoda]|uniref:Transcription factor CBF/NF-Y/archaeal histone domain-containing protein n=1 Tax=Amborella trichopoda TaxID=13333 RepID=W1P858_AMBTC|nr:chromatin accessibility complex protein 1 [Amborella trichopoda]ERN03859.1 hypothetical protein AMTR_s00078p00156890 [Amborella trichopoda]|eukprot:XP_006842184.1 chromatin accessibility complex protein 1 [Amborella trichopoda]